ncbi:MAG TPA: AAA family ATPase [Candidatus Eisenbacteria bacterium]|nr:AAA family ATPase [Candidatus Eisenbacteria bacterium]
MKLLRLRANRFGPLEGEYAFDPDKVTLIVDRNEAGKSSLLAAVGAALYGLENDRRSHRVITPLERWRPWEGDAYRVELELESDGTRFTIARDFARGTVEVWNDRGQEVTAEFREGKEDYPVGRKLLGLDAEEFEKTAFVRQQDLELVVPGDEKARRGSTLAARLESAADTRASDGTAAEAVQRLEQALRRYHCDVLQFEGTVDVAISRLENKVGILEHDLHNLDQDLKRVARPLAELSEIARQEEAARAQLGQLDAERRAGTLGDLTRQLAADDAARAELHALEAEAGSLASCAHVPPGVEAELREAIAGFTSAERNLDSLATRRQDEQSRERQQLEGELKALESYATLDAADADRAVTLAAGLRRAADDERARRAEVVASRESLEARGSDPGRMESAASRFLGLPEDEQRLLRSQAELSMAFHTQSAQLEDERAASGETLRSVDAQRLARRIPGGFVLALGLAAVTAGGTVLALKGDANIWMGLLIGGGAVAVGGALLLAGASGLRRQEREDALRALADANRRLSVLRQQRAETEVVLTELARRLGLRDAAEMSRAWADYVSSLESSSPLRRAQEKLESLEQGRRALLDEVRALLDRAGGGPADPSHLERVAAGIRHVIAVRQRLAEMEQSWGWIDDERRVVEATAGGLRERAVRILQSAGLTYDPARPWDDHVRELGERDQARVRWALLNAELIPQARRRILAPEARTELERQLETARGEGEPPATGKGAPRPGGRARGAVDIDREAKALHQNLDLLGRKRQDVRVQVDEVCQRVQAERPVTEAERDRTAAALARARRFKRTIERAIAGIQSAATDTHRRWAEFLDQRVAELLSSVGTRVEQLRFGEDLDFSFKLWNGQRVTRGRAVLQLSSGARDQLHLAVRLAIAEFLSKPGQSLPLLVDDVFATSDDDRARAGMRLLIEHFGRRHQILIATCHRARHDVLARLDPELWTTGVHVCDARPLPESAAR